MQHETVGKQIATLAVEALLEEALLSPKPGLVDADDCGAHNDMDIKLFLDSAHSFKAGFEDYFTAGYTSTSSLPELMQQIRGIGIQIEENMFAVTDGVNTHKGANFSFGILITALGYYAQQYQTFPSAENEILTLRFIIKEMTSDLIKNDFKHLKEKKQLTHGEKMYQKHGVAGIREEAEQGFPGLFEQSLPTLVSLAEKRNNPKANYLETLFILMKEIDDSNVLKRGGIEGAIFVKNTATEFLDNGGTFQDNYGEIIQSYNHKFIDKNISPGGAADLLALTIFMYKTVNINE